MSRMSKKEFSRIRNTYPIPVEVRKAVLGRAQEICEDCWTIQPLALHHLHYGNPFGSIFGKERPEDLAALCDSCHLARHTAPDGRYFRDPTELDQYWKYGQPSEAVQKVIQECLEYDRTHPEVWDTFAELAIGAIQAGRDKYSAGYIVYIIRYDTDIPAPSDGMAAYYARKFMIEQDRMGFFDTEQAMVDFWEPWYTYVTCSNPGKLLI